MKTNHVAVRARSVVLACGAGAMLSACGGGGGSPPPPPPPVPVVTLAANPTSLIKGETTQLTWSATNATTCTATGAWTGSQVLAGTSNQTPAAAGNSVFTLACTGAGGTVTVSTTVAVVQPTGLNVLTPTGFKVDARSASTAVVPFTTFDGVYSHGGIIPHNGAEILESTQALPPPPLDNAIDVQIHGVGGVVNSRSSVTVGGVTCTKVLYTEADSTPNVKVQAVYCPVGTKLHKFYLSYFAGDTRETQYQTAFQNMLNGVTFVP